MGTTYCLICEGEIPLDRLLTCSHECYIQLKFHKEEFKRNIEKKPDSMDALHVNIRRKLWQRELSAYNARSTDRITSRTCDICGREFVPKTRRSTCCSPTCANLKANGFTCETF